MNNLPPWGRPSYRPPQTERGIREKILIICEGEKTEPNYFKKFPFDSEKIEVVVHGEGMNTYSLVKEAVKLKSRAAQRGKAYNQVWCVFDRDSFPHENIKRAFQLARDEKIQVAYSNQCFEIWYLLHFEYINTAIPRHEYFKKLGDYLKSPYAKNSHDMYAILKEKQAFALKAAKVLYESYQSFDPLKNEPCTTVFQLVTILNSFLKSS